MTTPATISPSNAARTFGMGAIKLRIGPANALASTLNFTVTSSAVVTKTLVSWSQKADPRAEQSTVTALPAALPAGAVQWVNGVRVELTAPAAVADVLILHKPLTAGIASGASAQFCSVPVSALAQPVPEGYSIPWSNGVTVKALADAPATGTIIHISDIGAASIPSATTATMNLFPAFDNVSAIGFVPATGEVNTLQLFGKPATVSKTGRSQSTWSVTTQDTDRSSAVATALIAAEANQSPQSMRGFIYEMPDGSVYWGYADVSQYELPGGVTDNMQHSFTFATKEYYRVPTYNKGLN